MAAQHDYVSPSALAQGLGWFSVGLGLLELLAPRRLSYELGMGDRSGMIRAYGARELAAGIGILSQRDPTPWVWARVAGDALDIATLVGALPDNRRRGNVELALLAVAGVTLLDILCAAGKATTRPIKRYDYSDRRGMPRRMSPTTPAATRDLQTQGNFPAATREAHAAH
jgi:hypothetical protein